MPTIKLNDTQLVAQPETELIKPMCIFIKQQKYKKTNKQTYIKKKAASKLTKKSIQYYTYKHTINKGI